MYLYYIQIIYYKTDYLTDYIQIIYYIPIWSWIRIKETCPSDLKRQQKHKFRDKEQFPFETKHINSSSESLEQTLPHQESKHIHNFPAQNDSDVY